MYDGVLNVISQHNFTQFMITLRSAGFISKKLVNSVMAIDFAYTVFLILQKSKEVPVAEIKRIVQKWYVLSVLTGRYSSSPESAFATDIRLIRERGVVAVLKDIEAAQLSDNFWNIGLVQNLETTSTTNPVFQVYLASQIFFKDTSLLSANVPVSELITLGGDIHHIFPKKFLIEHGVDKSRYNQEGNYAYLDRPVNESIGKKAPKDYFGLALKQCETKKATVGSIIDEEELHRNLMVNCIPSNVFSMEFDDYDRFLEERRKLMAAKIRRYYESL
jgi:hypothetical protein